MNLNKLMKQAQKMQEQMAKTQAELEDKTVEVEAAGGKVTVVANGSGDVISIKIAKEIVDPEDVEFLEALIKEISGQDWKLKFILKEGLPVAPVPEASATTDESPARKKGDSQAMFKDDPLIREALEIFKGEIKTVSD